MWLEWSMRTLLNAVWSPRSRRAVHIGGVEYADRFISSKADYPHDRSSRRRRRRSLFTSTGTVYTCHANLRGFSTWSGNMIGLFCAATLTASRRDRVPVQRPWGVPPTNMSLESTGVDFLLHANPPRKGHWQSILETEMSLVEIHVMRDDNYKQDQVSKHFECPRSLPSEIL